MSDHSPSDEPTPDLAGELAFGLLTGSEKAYALRLQLSDPTFADAVLAWRARLAPLFSDFEEIAAPDAIWEAVSPSFTARTKAKDVLRHNIRLWKTLAIGTGLLAASLAILLVATRLQSPPASSTNQVLAVASLTGDAKAPLVTVVYDSSAGTLRLVSAGLQPDRKAPELWAIPADGKPRSLGFIAPAGSSHLIVPEDRRRFMAPGTTLAVTLENRSTMPHEIPGSTPILTGKLTKL